MNFGVSDAAAKSELSHQESGPDSQNPKYALDSFIQCLEIQVPFENIKCIIKTFSLQLNKALSLHLLGYITDGSHPSRKPQTLEIYIRMN